MNIPMNGPEALLGRWFGGYRLVSVVGQGATGAVFLGQRTETGGDRVTIKVLLLPWQMPASQRNAWRWRFQREAQQLMALRHPNILPILAFGEEYNLPYVVQPYLSGGTLRDLLAVHRYAIPLQVISYDLDKIADALDYAHFQRIIHRNIKPSNILYDSAGQIYLADFSFAAVQEALSLAGRIVSDPQYMAPELVRQEPATPASDLYSLGIVIYEIVTGRLPFQGNAFDIMTQQVNAEPPSPRMLRRDLTPAAETAILAALAKYPDERYPDARSFALAFSQAAAQMPSPVPPDVQKQYLTTKHLAGVIRLISLGNQTGTLSAVRQYGPRREDGEVVFVNGQIMQARCGALTGKAAEQMLMTWQECSYIFVETLNTGTLHNTLYTYITSGELNGLDAS